MHYCGPKKQQLRQNPLPLVRKKGLKALDGVPSGRSSGACTTVVQKKQQLRQNPLPLVRKKGLNALYGVPSGRSSGACTTVVQNGPKKQQLRQNPHSLYYLCYIYWYSVLYPFISRYVIRARIGTTRILFATSRFQSWHTVVCNLT